MNGLNELLKELRTREEPRLWVLIDAAGLPEGRASIDKSRFEQLECLFTGDLEVELADVAPHLGLLDLNGPNSNTHLEYLLGLDCAVLLTDRAVTTVTFAQAHRHFRKFNVVYGPGGRAVFFRYSDPRVLPSVLGVLDPEQLRVFLGPFDSIFVRNPYQNRLINLLIGSPKRE